MQQTGRQKSDAKRRREAWVLAHPVLGALILGATGAALWLLGSFLMWPTVRFAPRLVSSVMFGVVFGASVVLLARRSSPGAVADRP